ncbi:hypothetical protein ABPG72_022636 [Tetrahymena utriculariae]
MSKNKLQLREQGNLFVGALILIVSLPVVLMAAIATLWECIDRKFKGTPGTGFLFRMAAAFNKKTQSFNERFVTYKEDAYMMNVIILLAVLVPILFTLCLKYTLTYGFSLTLCLIYNVLRLGPFMINFAYAYALSHKEGHMGKSLYKEPYGILFQNVFNWFIGLFYGILPSTFAIGHSKNHHKYNNSHLDIISTADRPRDNFANWVRYLPRFTLYATNVSTVIQFYKERNYKCCINMIVGSLYFIGFVVFCYNIHPLFAFGYVIYPFFENVILLAAINWSWHAFIDPVNPDNEYAYNITIRFGTFNILEEDYHVVHHQYPGAHWTKHGELYEKHKEEYEKQKASMFQDTHAFEVFGFVAFKQYDILANKLMTKENLTHEQKVEFVKSRVRACTWGPFKNVQSSSKTD